VAYSLRDDSGAVVATGSHEVDGVGTTVLTPAEPLATWSPQTPVTYMLTANVGDDELNSTVAVRTFSAGDKAKLNGHKIELQGFSHHPSFAGMGAMTNPRLGLFLVQTSKALGVNFWRNSHNPYEDAVYELLTAVGLMCWDENRNFATWHANEFVIDSPLPALPVPPVHTYTKYGHLADIACL
jgi:beta-galactosidase/beta-glucuronidase